MDEVIARGLKLDANDRFPSRQPWLDALEDLHCEIRRKVQFSPIESTVLRLVGGSAIASMAHVSLRSWLSVRQT